MIYCNRRKESYALEVMTPIELRVSFVHFEPGAFTPIANSSHPKSTVPSNAWIINIAELVFTMEEWKKKLII